MGILSWFTGKESAPAKKTKESGGDVKPVVEKTEISEMNGAMEVPRPADVTVFEFGSATVSADKVTLAGYCTVSEELEPCRWEILPGTTSEAPQFRIHEPVKHKSCGRCLACPWSLDISVVLPFNGDLRKR